MSPAKSALGTVIIVAGCGVLAYAIDRWPEATITGLSAAAIYSKLRDVKEAPREPVGSCET